MLTFASLFLIAILNQYGIIAQVIHQFSMKLKDYNGLGGIVWVNSQKQLTQLHNKETTRSGEPTSTNSVIFKRHTETYISDKTDLNNSQLCETVATANTSKNQHHILLPYTGFIPFQFIVCLAGLTKPKQYSLTENHGRLLPAQELTQANYTLPALHEMAESRYKQGTSEESQTFRNPKKSQEFFLVVGRLNQG